nr:MAG TPA: hypothetical protein [Caudoviricetes sp.]
MNTGCIAIHCLISFVYRFCLIEYYLIRRLGELNII